MPTSGGDQPADVLLVGPPLDSGNGYAVLRERENRIEVGEIREMREGQPIHGDVVKLRQRGEHQRLFDVEVVAALPARSGPAQVASDAYRDGWDMVFGQSSDRTTN